MPNGNNPIPYHLLNQYHNNGNISTYNSVDSTANAPAAANIQAQHKH